MFTSAWKHSSATNTVHLHLKVLKVHGGFWFYSDWNRFLYYWTGRASFAVFSAVRGAPAVGSRMACGMSSRRGCVAVQLWSSVTEEHRLVGGVSANTHQVLAFSCYIISPHSQSLSSPPPSLSSRNACHTSRDPPRPLRTPYVSRMCPFLQCIGNPYHTYDDTHITTVICLHTCRLFYNSLTPTNQPKRS